jgi:ABC-type proline/glycine betaine transport system permease subunit
MKTILTNPKSAIITSFLLALPFVTLFLLFMLGIEPSLGPLDPLLYADDNHLSSIIVFGATFLLLVAFFVSLVPIVRNVQAGSRTTANPINLLLAVAILFFILMFVGGIIVDQYPCWIGVPNCD